MNTACVPITRFAEMVTARSGQDRFEGWVCDAEGSDLPEMQGFATGLRKDWDAVMASLSLHWSPARSRGT
ncbi:hypothetical protein [Streptomyces chartreusis]|uniref:hypothetical protein n=1 Tax=Streptomyces chartreusis TaxID=1969 RepID=UPI00380D96F3